MAAQSNAAITLEEEKKKQAAQNAAAAPVSETTTTTTTYTPPIVGNDYSDYLKDFHKEQENAAIADIEAAYNKNVATIDRAAATIPKQYEAARNQAAGAAAQAQRNADVHAAAVGLGSGTGAQARLANDISLQRNLNEVNTAEAEAKANIELQRSQLSADYNNAIAQAKANGNAALAEALYNEYIRAEQALIAQQQFNAQIGFQQQQHADALKQQDIDNTYRENVRLDSNAQFDKNYDLSYKQWQKALEQQKWEREYKEALQKAANDQWKSEYDLAFKQWEKALEQQKWENDFQAWLNEYPGGGYVGDVTVGGVVSPPVYNNGGLTPDEVSEMQKYFGVDADGKWGPQSSASVDGLNADEAWWRYEMEMMDKGLTPGTTQTPVTSTQVNTPAVAPPADTSTPVYYAGNGSLTPEQVKELQGFYGVDTDGKWGPQSTAAAGGMSADEAWETYLRETRPVVSAPASQPVTGFDYDLWGSEEDYYQQTGGTPIADAILNVLRSPGVTQETQDGMLKTYEENDEISEDEFAYILYKLGRL